MSKRDPILTPELIRILKIFLFSSFSLVLVFSFFNSYRADNTKKDRTFHVSDSNRLFFMNVRSIHYEREYRKDAEMTLFKHKKRYKSVQTPTLDPVLILNPKGEEAYIYFELTKGDFPIQLVAISNSDSVVFNFAGGNNEENLLFFKKLAPLWQEEYRYDLKIGDTHFKIWADAKEREVLNTVAEDYFRLLNQTN